MTQTLGLTPKAQFILDTSPLITLCTFKASGHLVIDHILPICEPIIPEMVALEATANPTHSDAVTVLNLLKTGKVIRTPNSTTPVDMLIDGYTKLGQGERDTIRLAITMQNAKAVLDDYLAFVVAMRFGVEAILLLDLVILFVKEHGLNKAQALEIVNSIAPRYSKPFVEHTRHKLSEVQA